MSAILVAALALVLAIGMLQSLLRLSDLERRRDQALESTYDGAAVAGPVAEAFRAFRQALRPGDRFALVFGPDIGRDQRGFYRLVALSYLYPAVAQSDGERADAVMIFDGGPRAADTAFDEIGVVAGVWLGRRSA